MKKQTLGQYFTKNDIWLSKPIKDFINTKYFTTIVDPFAGEHHMLNCFSDDIEKIGFDIDPALNCIINDSLKNIPKIENSICITNPPYLGNSSAKRFKRVGAYWYFDNNPKYTDLYQIGLSKCLESFDNVVAIVPETLISSKLFRDRLVLVNIMENSPFGDTNTPILVGCWGDSSTEDFKVFKNNNFISNWRELSCCIPHEKVPDLIVKFNSVDSDIGLIGIDGVKTNSGIRFCDKEEIKIEEIKVSSRARTRIKLNKNIDPKIIITTCNEILEEFRNKTSDILMSPFKGNNLEGKRRRRLDFDMAKKIIHTAIYNIEKDEYDK